MTTLSDKRWGVAEAGNSSLIDHRMGDVLIVNDYYPIGMGMPGRTTNDYRYGFNWKEDDGETGHYDFGARMYDARVGRFLSIDLFTNKFPSQTPYSFAANSPVGLVDYNGYFRISPFFAKRYPTLAKLVKHFLPMLKNDYDLRDRWIANIGFKDKAAGERAWDEMLTYCSGPWVTPNRRANEQRNPADHILGKFFGEARGGEYVHHYSNNLTFGYAVAEELEAAIAGGDAKEAGFSAFVVVVHVMHEGGHWGRREASLNPRNGYYYEDGAMSEEAIFDDNRFTYTWTQYADESMQAFDEKMAQDYYNSKYAQIQQGVPGGIFFMPKIGGCASLGSIRATKTPKGQIGDPTLKDNKDDENVIIPNSDLTYMQEDDFKNR